MVTLVVLLSQKRETEASPDNRDLWGVRTPGAGAEHWGRDRPGWGQELGWGTRVRPPQRPFHPSLQSLVPEAKAAPTEGLLAQGPPLGGTHRPCPSAAAGSREHPGGRSEGSPGCLLGRGGRGGQGAPSLQEAHGALVAPRGLQWEKRSHMGAGPGG